MMRVSKVFSYFILGLLLCSCVDKEGQELKSRLSDQISVPSPKGKLSRASIEQYRDAELAYNQRYVDELKKTLDNSFEKQLENFDKNELGFFSSYENMFHYISVSTRLWVVWEIYCNISILSFLFMSNTSNLTCI